MVNKYCICLIIKNPKGNILYEGCYHILDTVSFPNPDKAKAKINCVDRASFLRSQGIKAQPVVITGIEENLGHVYDGSDI